MKKPHAMKKILVIAILGLAGLEFTAEQAAADGPIRNVASNVVPACIRNKFCCKKCCVNLCAKQYNAFSPYCLDSMSGYIPMGGYAGYGPAACAGGGCAMGQLPAPELMGQHAFGAPGMMPAEHVQGWPTWAPGMVNPNAMPASYPAVLNYAPMPGSDR
jgi:hypothetical protein